MDVLLDPRLRTDRCLNIAGPNISHCRDRNSHPQNVVTRPASDASCHTAQLSTKRYPHIVATVNEIATVFGSWDWESKTRSLEDKVVLWCAKALCEGNVNAITMLDDLVSLYIGQGRVREAVELEKKIIDIYIGLFGESHEYTLAVMEGLMATYGLQGRSAEREELRERLMVARIRCQGGGQHAH